MESEGGGQGDESGKVGGAGLQGHRMPGKDLGQIGGEVQQKDCMVKSWSFQRNPTDTSWDRNRGVLGWEGVRRLGQRSRGEKEGLDGEGGPWRALLGSWLRVLGFLCQHSCLSLACPMTPGPQKPRAGLHGSFETG